MLEGRVVRLAAEVGGFVLPGADQHLVPIKTFWEHKITVQVSDPNAELVGGIQLNAPDVQVSSNDASTFKPYDPSEAIGPTSPSLPYITPPPKAGCNKVMMVLMTAVAVVVSVFTPVLAPVMSTALGVGATAGTMAAALTIGTAASAVARGIGSVLGEVSFSWRDVAMDGATAALSAGLVNSKVVGNIAKLFGGGRFATNAVSGALGNLGNQAIQRGVGLESHFSWKSVAASAVSRGIAGTVTPYLTADMGPFGTGFTAASVGGVLSLHTRRAMGLGGDIDYGAIAADAFGNALGNSINYVPSTGKLSAGMDAMQRSIAGKLDSMFSERAQADIDAMGNIGFRVRDIPMPNPVPSRAYTVGTRNVASTGGTATYNYDVQLAVWAEQYRMSPEARQYAYKTDHQLQDLYYKYHPETNPGNVVPTLDTVTVRYSDQYNIALAETSANVQRVLSAFSPGATYERNDIRELAAIGDFGLRVLAPTVREALHRGGMPNLIEQHTGTAKYFANLGISLWNLSLNSPVSVGGIARTMGYNPSLTEFTYSAGELTAAAVAEAATLGVGGALGGAKHLGYISHSGQAVQTFRGLHAAEKWGDVAADGAIDFSKLDAVPSSVTTPLSQAEIRARVEANVAQSASARASSNFDEFVQSEGRLYEKLDIWPPNMGRVGPVEIVDLQPGEIIDRFGLPNGRFLAPQATPFSARALPSGYEAAKPYFVYEVVKPIPGVIESRALPWFGQRGMGVQFELPRGTINYLNPSNGYVRVRYHEP